MEHIIYSSPKESQIGTDIWIYQNNNGGLSIDGLYWDKSPNLEHTDGDLELFLSVDEKDLAYLKTKVGVKSDMELIQFIINRFSQYKHSTHTKIREWLEKEGIKYSFFTY